MATIEARRTKAGKTRYRALVRLRGHPPQSATFERKTDARKWSQQTEAAIREGRYFRSAEAGRHTFEELVERYVEQVLPSKPKLQKAQAAQLAWWSQEMGSRRLVDVTPARVAEGRDKLRKGRSGATVNRYLAALSHAFTIAMKEWGWVDDNPCRKVRKLPEPRGRTRFLDETELTALLEACKSSDCEKLYALVLLALSTGARKGELLGLRWRDVDFSRGLLRLEETKNDERRAVPLTGTALVELRNLARRRADDSELVFRRQHAPEALDIRYPWDAALNEAGILGFRFHDLRHTAASYLAMSGATLAEIAGVLGHKTLAMVKRYSHLTDQHTSSVVKRMNEKFIG